MDNLQWRVWSWREGESITVKFSDGLELECDDDGDGAIGWEEEMWEESSEDCDKAGWIIEDDVYVSPNDELEGVPTRWRPMSELPAFMMVERLKRDLFDREATVDAWALRVQELEHEFKTLSDGVNRRLGQSTKELPLVTVDRASEIVAWAGAMLTALNVGDVASGSPLHLKLREVMVAFWHK